MLHHRSGILRAALDVFELREPTDKVEKWEPSTQTAHYRLRWAE